MTGRERSVLAASMTTTSKRPSPKRASGANFMPPPAQRPLQTQILLMSNFFGTVFAAISVSFVWITPSALQWTAMAGIGAMMLGAQALFLTALRRGDVSFVSPLFYGTMIFAAAYDLALYGVVPTSLSLIGITVILIGAVLLGVSEHRRAKGL